MEIKRENAVAAIRVSSVKQGLQGDSPQAQQEQIDRFAETHNLQIKKYFVFMESASKEQQPIQEAIDYCKNPKNHIDVFIIKSIDRFTRGGSYFYDFLKMQLTNYGVRLVDIYGIIGSQEVNTLEHLGVKYNWSVYSPTKKAEILEAERAKDEMRDIMSRMIGAEIRYVRLGYRARQAPFGYVNEKVETPHGKRIILKPHPEESYWILKMFELRIQGTLTDEQIVDEVNKLAFRSRTRLIRSHEDKKQVIGKLGGKKLHIKQLWRYLQRPIYAGINVEKWTQGQPVKGKYDGIVTIDMFNRANRGKVTIVEEDDSVKIYRNIPPRYLVKKGVRNPDFPYKRYVMCPECKKPLFGSASRGKMGKYYPAYHCNKRGHYFRVSKKEFDLTILNFVKRLHVTPKYAERFKEEVVKEWNRRQAEINKDKLHIDQKILELQTSARLIADKIKMLSSETAIRFMEEDLLKIEKQIEDLSLKKAQDPEKDINIEEVAATIKYFLEHLDKLLLEGSNPINRAIYFGLLFNTAPAYSDLISGTPNLAEYIALNEQFNRDQSLLVTSLGFEPKLAG